MLSRLFQIAAEASPRLTAWAGDYVHHTKLSNGIQIASQRRFSDKKLRFSVFIASGSFGDPPGKEGLAHHVEHVLYDKENTEEFENRYGSINAYTNCEGIGIHGHIENTNENLGFLIESVNDFLTAAVGDDIAEREQRRILNEIGIEYDTAENMHHKLLEKVLGRGTNAANIIGTAETVSAITVSDLNRFKKERFVGPNIFIAVTGVYDHKRFHNLLQRALGHIPAQPPPRTFSPHFTPGDHRLFTDAIHQLYFGFYFPLPPLDERGQAVEDIARCYLGKMLSRRLQDELGIVYHIQVDSYADRAREGYMGIEGNARPRDAGKIAPNVSSVLSAAATAIGEDDFEIVRQEVIDELNERKFVLFSDHSTDSMISDMVDIGRIVTVHERETLYRAIRAGDVRDLLAGAFSQSPAIIAYGDSRDLHGYEEFVRMMERTDQNHEIPAKYFP